MPKKLIEIARSFSYKHNCGEYQSADFFCSAKREVTEEEADEMSELMYEFCKKQVIRDLNEFKRNGIKTETPKTPEEEYVIAGVDFGKGIGKFPKMYKAKSTDTWRNKTYFKGNNPIDDCNTHDHTKNDQCLVINGKYAVEEKPN